MINEDHILNSNNQAPENSRRPQNADDEISQLFGSSINRMVSQYQAALRSGLDKEIEKVVVDFEKASMGSNEIVAKRMKSRIEELVMEEVRRVFDSTLQGAERSFAGPIRARAADLDGSAARERRAPDKARDNRRNNRRRDRSQISGSVPQGYPQTRANPVTPEAQAQEQLWTYNDQEAPISNAGPTQFPSEREAEVREPSHSKGPSPVPTTAWVLPGGDSQTKEAPQAEAGNQDDGLNPGQPSNNSPKAFYEPDDEVDPFITSMDDDPASESDYYSTEEFDHEDTSELPDNALTAVMNENTDLTTITHDSKEVVHVLPTNELASEEANFAEAISEPVVAESEDKAEAIESVDAVSESAEVTPAEEDEADDTPSEAVEKDADSGVAFEIEATEIDEVPEDHDDQDGQEDADSDMDLETEATEIDEAPEDHDDQDGQEDADSDMEVATEAVEIDESSDASQTESPDADDEVAVPVLSGSVEIDNEHVEGEDAEIPETTTFEGTVRLNVEAPGCIKEIVNFVRELRQKPELRLLRLVGNNKEGVDIWLGLREPLRIKSMLPEIEGVNITVRPLPHVGGQDEKLLGVRMIRIAAVESVSEVS